jgi:hypothetical protein
MSVSSFKLLNDTYEEPRAKLDYRIVIDCITHFPNIEEVFWNTGHDEWTPNHDDSPADKVLWNMTARAATPGTISEKQSRRPSYLTLFEPYN